MRLHIVALAIAGACALASPQVWAQHERPPLHTAPPETVAPPSPSRWDGNATGWTVGAVLSWLDAPLPTVSDWGMGLRASARISTVVQLLDVEAVVSHTRFSAGYGALTRTGIGGQINLHPGFPFTVYGDLFNDVVAGMHGLVAVEALRSDIGGSQAVSAVADEQSTWVGWHPALTIGLGLDVPLGRRGEPSGLWLTARATLRMSDLGERIPAWDGGERQVQLLVGWRSYSTAWARLPRPF